MKIFLICTLTIASIFAQTAEVHDLLPAESANGAALYKAAQDAQHAYDVWATSMAVKYIDQTKDCNTVGPPSPLKICHTGEFSIGHRQIMPKTTTTFVNNRNALTGPQK